jgi:hypothetical protein
MREYSAKVRNLRRILALAVLWPAAGLVAAEPAPAVTPMGDNTFSLTRQAKTTFDRDVEKYKAEVRQDAANYCESQHKQLKVLTVTSERPFYTLGFTSATIVFKALDAGSPELAPAPPTESSPAVKPGEAGSAPTLASAPGGDLYTELLKLDDLRKRGLLTDKEFESEKKKLLKRSK